MNVTRLASWVFGAVGLVACAAPTDARDEAQGTSEGDLAATAATSCSHAICSTGAKLAASCDACVTKVCNADSYCCKTGWDKQCVSEVGSICGTSCTGGGGGGGSGGATCSHDACTTGAKLAATCDACAAKVCASDAYCCSSGWDSQCVGEAKNACGSTCSAPPPPPVDAGTGTDAGGGGVPTGTIGPDGGTLSSLVFGVVGDTRPAVIDDTAGYPSAVITSIYDALAAPSLAPPFVVSTGDYSFSSPEGTASAKQYDLYLQARSHYAGAWFPTMGNHECTGYTNSNCGDGNADGTTAMYSNYLDQLLGPIQKTLPYYVIHVSATDGSWTSKFVFVAANAWSSAQASWLTSALAEKTTYTFIVRHEAGSVTQAPGVSPSEKIIAKYPYTLKIVGHDHTYTHTGKELLVGNGGAPLTDSVPYGYAMLRQRTDGAIAVDMYDVDTGKADASFHFAVNADGSAASP